MTEQNRRRGLLRQAREVVRGWAAVDGGVGAGRSEEDESRDGRRRQTAMRDDCNDIPDQLRSRVQELGLELQLRHLGTPGQLAFALPVRGLDYWGPGSFEKASWSPRAAASPPRPPWTML
jgi:hypothetical protein